MKKEANNIKIFIQNQFIDKLIASKENVKILDAGCGSNNYLKLKSNNTYLVGLDISKEQIIKNKEIDSKVVGNIQFCNFRQEIFDLIICCDVLEHLSRPMHALKN